MFERILKLDRIQFSEGSLAFQTGSGVLVYVLLLVLLIAGLFLLYRSTAHYTRTRDRVVSFGLRAAALLLLFVPLFEPVLVVPDVVPDENFVAVVVDASESMNVPDARSHGSRIEEVGHLLHERGLLDAIDEHFKVRHYVFGEDAQRIDRTGRVVADRHETNLSAALERVLNDFRGLPLTGAVVLTDGADNSSGLPLEQAEAFRDRDIALHVVGVGRDRAENERELLQATVTRGVELSTGAEIDVRVRSWRSEPEPVAMDLYHGSEIVYTARHRLKGHGKVDYFTIYYEPSSPEPREYTLRLAGAPDEVNLANNEIPLLIVPRRDTLRVLFIEGHPRRDFKFIKRALEDDQAVHVSSILRTGTGKFYRQGIVRSDELAGGFPASEEELFGFRAVLLGDLEAAHFTPAQLEMMERFVRIRGGGLAMLGGKASFAEGAYWSNPVSDLLPVSIDPARRSIVPVAFSEGASTPGERGFSFEPTDEGLQNSILRLAADPADNRDQWLALPRLTSINHLGRVKPGATVLAEKVGEGVGDAEPLLVVQRYGKGRSAALATASTWRWQMLADSDDRRHARFWRQFVRWLGASAPGRIEIALDSERISPGAEVGARVNLYERSFRPETAAEVHATLTDDTGRVHEVAFRENLGEPGVYSATLLPVSEGLHVAEVAAEFSDGTVVRADHTFLVRPSRQEYYDAVLNRDLLQQIARTAGGVYYDVEHADDIPANLRGRRSSTSVYRAEYIWDMPLLFLLVVSLLVGEWAWRRRRHLS